MGFFWFFIKEGGEALMYIGGGGVACCSWEGRPPCRPLPIREPLTGLSALGTSWIFIRFQTARGRRGGRPSPTDLPGKCHDDEPYFYFRPNPDIYRTEITLILPPSYAP